MFSPVMPFWLGGLFEKIAELLLQHAVVPARLLLFAQLQTVAHDLGPAVFAVLAGGEVALLDGALFGVAALTFQEQFHPFAPAQPADRADVSCHTFSPYLTFLRCSLQPHAAFILLYCSVAISLTAQIGLSGN